MGLMYAWATKEYLLERMSWRQIEMYLNHGVDIKYPQPKPKDGSLVGASAEEIRARRDKLRKQYGHNIEGL